MKQLIDSILTAEQEAKTRIEQAQKNAAQKKAQAEADADSILQRAKEQATLIARQKIDEAKQQSAQFIEKTRLKRESIFTEQYKQLEPVIEQAVQTAVMIVSASVLDNES
ncbi:MAG TPA: V-type ATPase subunit subunit G family protein [Spirochaetia bacterium]|nr:V-type ATPase subunit subunit G family protein [Spirochaetales bacterium]HRS64657.1 V-type ATPase subunit subunit G family protein [Spirochaetia bacterium]HOT58077.1 V-type ATPase subunit subunit G family protein [Spirochaetales bacterium]HPD79641.1 V-type ATPase subunit subunit G family protein [Spirochaetales bacterium]HQG40548.1 V-type ATPase subunit subunit G family protein [Spirochaetales bacterium]